MIDTKDRSMIMKLGIIFLLSFHTLLSKFCTAQYSAEDNSEDIKALIEFNAVSYADKCKEFANSEWKFINNPSNENLLQWEEAQANYSSFKNEEVSRLRNDTQSIIDDKYTYELGVEEKPGDMLMNFRDWKELVSFSGKTAVLRTGINYTNGTENHSRRDTEKFLLGNYKVEDKRSTWSKWHRRLLPLVDDFSSMLKLASEAAEANGMDNVANYWELLSGYTDGYEKIKTMWEEITELHKKLITFVQNRISQRYKIQFNDTNIPAYLLGSLDASNWISIAPDVMPYGDITHSVIKNLWNKNLRGEILYKSVASAVGKSVFKRNPTADVWRNSKFNNTCSTKLINFCTEGRTRILTCHQASLGNFLTAHKIIAQVLTTEIKADGTDTHWVVNMANRYSGLDEGLSELFSILSVSPGQLIALKLIDNTTETEQSKISSLMITALDVLPRLAYYLSADLWRIDVIKNGTFQRDHLLKSWWEYRKQYEGVTSESYDIPTFLDDEFITSNKPYLPKFVGTVLAFQLYQYLTDSTEVRYDPISNLHPKSELLNMFRDKGAQEWTNVITNDLSIYDISATTLTEYFAPLMEYLDSNSDDIHPLTKTQESDLRSLEEKYGSVEVTTTAPIKSTTTSSPNSKSEKNGKEKPAQKSSDPSKPLIPATIPDEKSNKKDTDVAKTTEKAHGFGIDDTEESKTDDNEYTGGMNTSKAVWAVSVALVATVTICIIAIFGRRRCVKSQTPKNRRYV